MDILSFLLQLVVGVFILHMGSCRYRRYQQKCPGAYLRYSSQHTACRPANPQCNIYSRGIDKRDKELIVRKHNYLRNLVALGYERSQPSATNMMEMVWDDELAGVAQKHADLCRFAHDCENCRSVEAFSVGQNIATKARTGNTLPVPDWNSILQDLYDEVRDFSPRWISPFKAPRYPMTGHYSQMLWAKSWKIGCGYTIHSYSTDPRFKFVELYTCNYGPKGNIYSTDMYKIGRACTECPENTCCGSQCGYARERTEFEGLCKPVNRYGPQPRAPTGNVFLFCNFRTGYPNSEWCDIFVEGSKNWKIKQVATGTYATTSLTGGQTTIMNFGREMNLPRVLCFHIEYRKGPAKAGDFSNNRLSSTLVSTREDAYYNLNFTSDANDWATTDLPVNWLGGPAAMSLRFDVPYGAPTQYLDLREVVLQEGRCRY